MRDAEAMKTTLRWQKKGRRVVVVVYSKQASRQSRWIGTTRLTGQWKDLGGLKNGTHFEYCDWLSASDPNMFLFIHGGDSKLVEKLSTPVNQHLRSRPAKGTLLHLTHSHFRCAYPLMLIWHCTDPREAVTRLWSSTSLEGLSASLVGIGLAAISALAISFVRGR